MLQIAILCEILASLMKEAAENNLAIGRER